MKTPETPLLKQPRLAGNGNLGPLGWREALCHTRQVSGGQSRHAAAAQLCSALGRLRAIFGSTLG